MASQTYRQTAAEHARRTLVGIIQVFAASPLDWLLCLLGGDQADRLGSPQQEQGQEARGGQREVGGGVAAKVSERTAQRSPDGVAGGPGEVGRAEGEGSHDTRALGAAREEGGAGDERGVEGAAGEHDEECYEGGDRGQGE